MAEGLLGIVSGINGTFGLIVGVTVIALIFARGFSFSFGLPLPSTTNARVHFTRC